MSAPKVSDWRLAARLLPYMRPHAGLFAVAVLLAPASAAMAVLQPLLLKKVVDEHIVPLQIEGLEQAAMLYLAAVLCAFVCEAGYTLAISFAAMRTITEVRSEVYRHSLTLAQSYHDRVPTGRLLTRATSDVEALGETLTAGAITIVLDIMLVMGILAAMVSLDARMTLVLMVVAPPIAITVELIRRVLRRLFLRIRTSLSELNAFLAERLNGIRVVQLQADEARTLEGFDERLYRYRDTTIRTNVFDALLYAIIDGLASISMALMLWYASGGGFDGAVTAGLLAAFIEYIGQLFRPIREFSQKLAVIQRAISALEKIWDLLGHDESIPSGDRAHPEPAGHLALRDLRFGYVQGTDVLKGVSLDIQPGEVVAVVGRTGSGKSTLGKLLNRSYTGYRGSIELDGHELTDLSLSDVRRTIGTVHQDVQLFPGTVRFNLALGHDIPDEPLMRAIELVHATQAVDRLGGLEGRVEHQGNNLSVGEAQLISFARTMAHDPPIVILDEATASVDSMTEQRIQEATEAILSRKTVLVVAHRLSTIMHADRIAVMDSGRVAELGDHATLMAKGGLYAELFRAQFDDGSHTQP